MSTTLYEACFNNLIDFWKLLGTCSTYPLIETIDSIQVRTGINGPLFNPVFLKNSKKVVGVINGNMNWGNEYLRVPLSIAYFTSVKTIKSNTPFFNSLSMPIFTCSKFKNIINKLLRIN